MGRWLVGDVWRSRSSAGNDEGPPVSRRPFGDLLRFGESKLYEDPPGPLCGVGLIAACSYLVAASNHLPVEMDARHRCMDARSEVAVSTTSLEIKISLRMGLVAFGRDSSDRLVERSWSSIRFSMPPADRRAVSMTHPFRGAVK